MNNNIDIHDRVTEAYYGKLGKNIMQDTRNRIHWIAKQVTGEKVLDVGCSQGLLSVLIAREGKKVLGIDYSEKSIKEAKEFLLSEEKHTQSRVNFVLGDFISYDFSNKQFDTIIMGEILEHLCMPIEFIEKSSRLLNENGKIIITVPFGINDFIDHKQTFYFYDLFNMIEKYLSIKEYKILGKWIGFVVKNKIKNSHDIDLLSVIKELEKNFYLIERNLIDVNSENNLKIKEIELKNESLSDKLSKIIINYEGMVERNKKLQKEKEDVSSKISHLENSIIYQKEKFEQEKNILLDQNKKLKTNLEGMDHRNKRLQNQVRKMEEELEKTKNSLSFRWGHAIVKSRRSIKSLLKLPYIMYREYKIVKRDRKNSPKRKILVKKKKNIDFTFNRKELKGLKIASIMDEFTYSSFKYECNLFQLTPKNWKRELRGFNADFLFIESAWRGKDDQWSTKISGCSQELIALVNWCHSKDIPIIFWNKEDPVHFDTFLDVAKIVDITFTTDLDSIPKYKSKLGHENVFFLPFAAQPVVHNPIEKFERKDAFNFAGSYYLRYLERQRDFASLMEAVESYKPIEIYDRNYDNPHPHYTFPEKYKPYILGKLPFSEIDKAYKGYKYGINMNTIKQSQTMFARRVYELLASNTVVVSNFSRGVRLLFGDLVISSDNSNEIKKRLESICNNELTYRKFRLLGLRKVMREHTYADRLSYILSKVSNEAYQKEEPKVVIFSIIKTEEEYFKVLKSFEKQDYSNKILLTLTKCNLDNQKEDKENIKVYKDIKELEESLKVYIIKTEKILFGIMDKDNYYGSSYLQDLVLATLYAPKYEAYGKYTHYKADKNRILLENSGTQYQQVEKLMLDASLVKIEKINQEIINQIAKKDYMISFSKMFSIDEFNFCYKGESLATELLKEVDDLELKDNGISFIDTLATLSEKLPPKEKEIKHDTLPHISAKELYTLFNKSTSSKIELLFNQNRFEVITKLGKGKHLYIYTETTFLRKELNFVLNSQFILESTFTMEDVRTVFEFQDKNRQKISHSMNRAGAYHALAIPNECVYIRFGLKLVGNGKLTINRLILGTQINTPFALVAKSKKLILTKQYPSYDDIYKYGFLHSRVRAYREAGLSVDIFRINSTPQNPFREFENIDIATGNAELLEETLNTGQYDHVLVHLIDQHMWRVLEKFIDKIKVTVWVHGAEIQTWQQRSFDLEYLEEKEQDRQKKLSDDRVQFWKELTELKKENLKFIFVSKWLLESSQKYCQIKFPKSSYQIIHNYIDEKIFKYHKKNKNDRLNILSIRPYAKRVYANDLTAQTILELSKKDFFQELNFTIIGDGILFEEITQPLKRFSNVKIIQKFLRQKEIAQYHKKHGILLVPTRMDTQGVSRDEAMSSGLVPITTNVAAVPEFVDNSCGMVVEPENPKALADAIEYLYKNPEKFLELSKAAAKRVREQCSFENSVRKEILLMGIDV